MKPTNFLKITARVRLNVDRGEGGKYLPNQKGINYNISAEAITSEFYALPNQEAYVVDLFKDFYLSPGLLSTLKTNNKAINVLGSIYAEENAWDNCLLLNTDKNVVEALNGNLFLISGETVKTPPLGDGCLKGVMRKQLIEVIATSGDYTIEETSISPFELQKADEMFISNVIVGVQPILRYRKKTYTTTITADILRRLNIKLRLG